jgi:tetratricopeptide (TPR) repeat protein
LGWAYLEAGRPSESTPCFQRGLQTEPSSAYGRRGLAESYLAKGLTADALGEFQKVVSADSTDVDAMVGIGTCQSRLGNLDAAESVLRRAIDRAPGHALAHRELGATLVARELFSDAVNQYRIAIQLQPDDIESHLGLGAALEKTGQLAAAEEALKAGLEQAPRDPRLHYHLGLVYLDMKDTGRASTFLETALDECGDDTRLRATIQAALDSIK